MRETHAYCALRVTAFSQGDAVARQAMTLMTSLAVIPDKSVSGMTEVFLTHHQPIRRNARNPRLLRPTGYRVNLFFTGIIKILNVKPR